MVIRWTLAALFIALLPASPELFAQNGTSDKSSLTQPLSHQLRWESARAAVMDIASPDASEQNSGKGIASLRSLLIPGWGQLKSGNKLKGYSFLAAEVTLITLLITFKSYSGWLEDDYRAFARQHAGISGGKDQQFYVDMGNWKDHIAYNEQRIRYRQFDIMYTAPDEEWSWDSEENRLYFKSLRINADRAGHKALLVSGALLLNHLLSAVDAARGSNKTKALSISPNLRGGITVNLNFLTGH